MQLFKRGDVIRTRKREGFVLSNQKPGVPFVNVEDTEDGAVYPVHTDNISAHKYNDDGSDAGNCRVCNFYHGEWSATPADLARTIQHRVNIARVRKACGHDV